MFQFVVAASMAFGSEAVDGIFKRAGSCSSGSCSTASAKVVEAKPVEAKPAAKAVQPAKQESACGASSCSSARTKRLGNLFGRCR